MYQLTQMKHFKERLECWLFQDKFSEIMYGIGMYVLTLYYYGDRGHLTDFDLFKFLFFFLSERSLVCITESSNVITTK